MGKASGEGDLTEDDNFVVTSLRLFRRPRGLQPSVAACRAPKFGMLEEMLGGTSKAFLMDHDMGRVASLKGLTSYRGVYPQIAYEDSLLWEDDRLHPFLSLPDCSESLLENLLRGLRTAPGWNVAVQCLTAILLLEATAKAIAEKSFLWAGGAAALVLVVLLRLPPFLRFVADLLPAALFAPELL
eukprot:NODE_983_length_1281_cov_133.139478.p2 GENE.NODE_983_length_1281_cov_133.139478~~NODE_983_length_1281_cov_133.139478.p2  ORF type:complete len:185 (+),score=67.07 NODE_983_length_1281_cov_133.139478:3-557(+)